VHLWLSDFFLSFSLERRTNEQEITEETENRHSPLFAPVENLGFIIRVSSVFDPWLSFGCGRRPRQASLRTLRLNLLNRG
jgi:hypothetical protein